MGRSTRLLLLLRPYTPLCSVTLVTTVVASVLDGVTFVLLIPFLRTLFGQEALPASGGSAVERLLAAVVGPVLGAGAPHTALHNVVLVLLGTLVLKNMLAYVAALTSVAIQENVVRDLRVRLFEHLQTLSLGFFQRTRGGQLLARVINDTDQVKTAITAALASLLQNASLIVVYVGILVGLSWRLTLLALVCAPLLVVIVRPLVGTVRRRSREEAVERVHPGCTAARGAVADRGDPPPCYAGRGRRRRACVGVALPVPRGWGSARRGDGGLRVVQRMRRRKVVVPRGAARAPRCRPG